MEEENKMEKGCKIYTIFFKNNEESYDFGKVLGKANEILRLIAKFGGTNQTYTSENLGELTRAFVQINKSIKNNFGLKLSINKI